MEILLSGLLILIITFFGLPLLFVSFLKYISWLFKSLGLEIEQEENWDGLI